jgi:hypothetical protein
MSSIPLAESEERHQHLVFSRVVVSPLPQVARNLVRSAGLSFARNFDFSSISPYQKLPFKEAPIFLLDLFCQQPGLLVAQKSLNSFPEGELPAGLNHFSFRNRYQLLGAGQFLCALPATGLCRTTGLFAVEENSANSLRAMTSPPARIVAMFATFHAACVNGQHCFLSRFANSCRA